MNLHSLTYNKIIKAGLSEPILDPLPMLYYLFKTLPKQMYNRLTYL